MDKKCPLLWLFRCWSSLSTALRRGFVLKCRSCARTWGLFNERCWCRILDDTWWLRLSFCNFLSTMQHRDFTADVKDRMQMCSVMIEADWGKTAQAAREFLESSFCFFIFWGASWSKLLDCMYRHSKLACWTALRGCIAPSPGKHGVGLLENFSCRAAKSSCTIMPNYQNVVREPWISVLDSRAAIPQKRRAVWPPLLWGCGLLHVKFVPFVWQKGVSERLSWTFMALFLPPRSSWLCFTIALFGTVWKYI